MAKRRLLKFFLSLVVLFVVVGVVAVIGAWMLVSRGPSVPDNSTLILRIGGELVESPPNDVLGQVTGGAPRADRPQLCRCAPARQDRSAHQLRPDRSNADSNLRTGARCRRSATRSSISRSRESAFPPIWNTPASASTTSRRPPTASICVPTSALDVTGVATYQVFLKGTLDKIGAQADFEKIGDYKTAPNQLTADHLHSRAQGDDASR